MYTYIVCNSNKCTHIHRIYRIDLVVFFVDNKFYKFDVFFKYVK